MILFNDYLRNSLNYFLTKQFKLYQKNKSLRSLSLPAPVEYF
jgi:hypothetical protein